MEVARQYGVSRVSALRWERQRQAAKTQARQRRPLGRRPKLTPAHQQALAKALEQRAQAHGFLHDLWMPTPGCGTDRTLGPSAVASRPCLAALGADGLASSAPQPPRDPAG